MKLAESIARNIGRRQPPWIDREDLVSAAYLGLTKAAHKYNPKTKVPFDAYARIRIHGEIMDSLRRKNFKHNSTLQLFPEHSDDRVWIDPMTDLEIEIDRDVLKHAVRDAVERMPEGKQKQFVEMKYLEGMTGKQAGEKLGVKKPAASHLHKLAIVELRRVVTQSPDRELLMEAA